MSVCPGALCALACVVACADADLVEPSPASAGAPLCPARTGFEVSASSEFSAEFPAAAAVDGSVDSKWVPTPDDISPWITIELPGPAPIAGVIVQHAEMAGEGQHLNAQRVQISVGEGTAADLASWKPLIDAHNPRLDAVTQHDFAAPEEGRFWRLEFAGGPADGLVRIPEITLVFAEDAACLGGRRWSDPLDAPRVWHKGFAIHNSLLVGNSPCYQQPRSSLQHTGEDHGVATAAPVRSIAAGRVEWISDPDVLDYPGAVVLVRHPLTLAEQLRLRTPEAAIYSAYSHLDYSSLAVWRGQWVAGSDVIANLHPQGANTHLHHEIRSGLAPEYDCVREHNRNVLGAAGPGYVPDARGLAGYVAPSRFLDCVHGRGDCESLLP